MTTAEAMKILETKSLKKLSVKELKEIGRPIISTAKKRVRLIEEKNLLYSPAYQGYIVMKGMKGSLAGNNVNKLRHEIYEAVKFLKAKTSTIRGIREYDKLLESFFGEHSHDEEFRNLVWSAFQIIENESPHVLLNFNYREVVQRIAETNSKYEYLTPRELMEAAMGNLGYVNIGGLWMYEVQEDEDDYDWDDIW